LLKRKAIRTVAAKVKGHDWDVLECNYFAKSHVTFTSGSNLLWYLAPLGLVYRVTGTGLKVQGYRCRVTVTGTGLQVEGYR